MPRTKNNNNGSRRTKYKTTSLTTNHNLNSPDKNPNGRPPKFKTKYIKLARNFTYLGATIKDLAYMFEVTESTVKLWGIEYPKFSASIKKAKEEADANIACSLYRRAMGYETIERKYKSFPVYEEVTNGLTGEVKKEIVEYEMRLVEEIYKHTPGETKAMEMWLTNRTRMKKEHLRWRRIQKLEVTGPDGKDLIPPAEADAKALATRDAMLVELANENMVIDV